MKRRFFQLSLNLFWKVWGYVLQRVSGIPLCLGAFLVSFTTQTLFAEISASMQQRIIERVENRPQDASAWRMLAKVQLQNRERAAAERSLRKAIELEPGNAAAHNDLGQLLIENKREQEGLEELQKVLRLAPETEYAKSAETYLDLWGIDVENLPDNSVVSLVGFESGEFDGSKRREETEETPFEPMKDPEQVLNASFDIGLQYNSNVALAPTSRQLVPGNRESFQLLLSPDLEWTISKLDNSRWGVTYFGQWTFNEGNFRNFNLESYQPGLFWEKDIFDGPTIWVPRLSYEYIYDLFDGDRFGNRHAFTASTLAIWDDRNSTYGYYAADLSSFQNTGTAPNFTSQDGWSHAVGLNHEWYWEETTFRSFTLGGDLQSVDTEGSDFRYRGIQFYAESLFVPAESWELSLEGGAGFRDYYDFSGAPSRDEFNYRGVIELEKKFSDQFSLLTFFRYQSFNSDNSLFDANQYLAGVLTRFEY